MSYVIVTNVFCDFCPNWDSDSGGACAAKVERRRAWFLAKRSGWILVDGKHMCPLCLERAKNKKKKGV